MKKRLAILAVAAVGALSAIGSASGAMNVGPSPSPNAPGGAQCPGADLTCKM